MDRPRPRQRQRAVLSGFTKAEIKKLEKLLTEPRDVLQTKEFCRKIARNFSSSAYRTGKPSIKWIEVRSWFLARQKESTSKVRSLAGTSKTEYRIAETCSLDNGPQISQFLKVGEKIRDISELQFEAKSSKDGAWYDVDTFLTQRHLGSGEAEVLARFIGFGADEDEWVNVKNAVRLRSIPFEHSECNKLAVGDLVLCLQEKRDQLIYHDVHVIEIERKTHDIRGCRCIFLIRYDHDGFEERVRLRRLFKIQGQQIRLLA
ncbi:protein SAWADEE HOMEODOMAIN HOMOLOG 1-like [Hibiscus syriacus]|uniref:protein SAWADEE HOMEODOMAIN HOMOLOG 1-like n=1 Tax=Hibiscus syriacus TaxID=106335 RepID=UPI001923B5C7|nr:protein SAWADEE HOMEODOMAIN HOMOLOG 1-like [Hibiscus syriacus]